MQTPALLQEKTPLLSKLQGTTVDPNNPNDLNDAGVAIKSIVKAIENAKAEGRSLNLFQLISEAFSIAKPQINHQKKLNDGRDNT